MPRKDVNLLVVDDSVAILMFVEAILNELGYDNVTTYDSAEKALEEVQQAPQRFAGILTDLNMPGMDGMEFMRQLGELGYRGGVIIVSEMAPRVIDLASELAKQNRVLLISNISKPVQLNEVELALNKLNLFREREFSQLNPLTEQELLNAISNNQLTPFYQPKVHRSSNTIKSVEVLARICDPRMGDPILPARFIRTAQEHDLTNLVLFQLFEKATRDYRDLVACFGYEFKLAFNITPQQLNDLSCPDKLALILEINNLRPEQVILEITEEHALKSNTQLETINRLRMRGYGLSLDDFGTGFTNVHQLRTLPYTEIKIDRTLISNIETDRFSQVIVQTLIDIASKERIDLVAEGIERLGELEFLQKIDTDILLQGYLISLPKAKDELIAWFRTWSKLTQKND